MTERFPQLSSPSRFLSTRAQASQSSHRTTQGARFPIGPTARNGDAAKSDSPRESCVSRFHRIWSLSKPRVLESSAMDTQNVQGSQQKIGPAQFEPGKDAHSLEVLHVGAWESLIRTQPRMLLGTVPHVKPHGQLVAAASLGVTQPPLLPPELLLLELALASLGPLLLPELLPVEAAAASLGPELAPVPELAVELEVLDPGPLPLLPAVPLPLLLVPTLPLLLAFALPLELPVPTFTQ
jgi:hypothetical protein